MSVVAPDLVYFCDWLPPEFGAVGQYSLQFARSRAQAGEHVALYGLTSSSSSIETETFTSGSLRIVRLKANVYDRASFRERSIWTLRNNLSLVGHAWRDICLCKEILFTGSPPFLLHLLAPLNAFVRKKLTYRITDFFPECLMVERDRPSAPLKLLHWLTLFWRRRVTKFEVLGEDQRSRLIEAGISPGRIFLKRDPSPVRIPLDTIPLQLPEQIRGYRVLLYSGNFGVAHDYLTFLNAFRKHHHHGSRRVALWLNAVGSTAEALERGLVEERLPYARTWPVPLDQLPSLLVAPDAHLITLRDRFSGYVLPSKVHACIESKRPIVYVGPTSSDVHLLCSPLISTGLYSHIAVGDVESLLHVLERM